ncbi:MAG: hypothetical protein JXD23_13795 [Spirochaetales bacterium]|nr:hypothetical protein [Spirochaetales bacterium]
MKIVRMTVCAIALLFVCPFLYAETKKGVHKNSFGIMFQIESFTKLIDNYTDGGFYGGQGGVGIRYWLLPELVLRGVVYLDFRTITATSETAFNLGLSAGAEYHFVKGEISPYGGVMGGLEHVTDVLQSGTDFFAGAFFGVELTPMDVLAFFIEYSVLATFRETGVEVDLGYNHLPTFGLIIYFN